MLPKIQSSLLICLALTEMFSIVMEDEKEFEIDLQNLSGQMHFNYSQHRRAGCSSLTGVTVFYP